LFYERYIELCKAKGISASAAATAIGFSKSSVSHWKNSGGAPRYEIIYKISEFFGVSVDELTNNEAEPTKPEPTEAEPTEPENAEPTVGATAPGRPLAEPEIITSEPEISSIIETEAIIEPEIIAEAEIVAEPELITEPEIIPEPLALSEAVPEHAAVPENPQIFNINYSLTEKSIREIRRGLRISLNTAAREIGVSPEELQAYEDGRTELRGYRKIKLEQLLKVGKRL
jgi:transcriptional regulator with XRE-family HTH domain